MQIQIYCDCSCPIEYFNGLFEEKFSADQEKVLKEREAFIFFMDYIEDCEGMYECGTYGQHPLYKM